MDFYGIKQVKGPDKTKKVRPYFLNHSSNDVFIKDKEFYAVWDYRNNIWSTSIYTLIDIIDEEVAKEVSRLQKMDPTTKYVQCKMAHDDTKLLEEFNKWCKRQDDNFKPMNCKVKFANEKIRKTDYCDFKLPYSIEDGPRYNYDELMTNLYEPEEIDKIEWAIGAIITGDSKTIEKAIAFYGDPGSGKSTVLKIISNMFKLNRTRKYYGPISTKDLAKKNDNFSASSLKDYKLILIDHDANLTHLDENTTLNTIISHEPTRANSKYGSDTVVENPVGFLMLATNGFINMTDAKSGLKRRFIVVNSKGSYLIDPLRYDELMDGIKDEYGSIAYHCKERYLEMGIDYYKDYEPLEMYEFSNALYNWVSEEWKLNLSDTQMYRDGISLNDAWTHYKEYCEESGYKPGKKTDFKIDMCSYFETEENYRDSYGKKHRYFFTRLKPDKTKTDVKQQTKKKSWLDLECSTSILDDIFADQPAQYQIEDDNGKRPKYKWINCKTTLQDIDTSKTHFVKPINETYIVIDFDLRDESGEKSKQLNLKAASEWPKTYAEFSASGNGLHLHYIYDGDPDLLDDEFDKDIEIKVYTGNSALRRKVSKCNNVKIAYLHEGDLPLKSKRKHKDMISTMNYKNAREIEENIYKCLKQEIGSPHIATEINFIQKILDEAYDSGIPYDLRYMKKILLDYATLSSKESICISTILKMHFCSADVSEDDFVDLNDPEYNEAPIAFFDIEILPNLFLINWKILDIPLMNRLVNPSYSEVEKLFLSKKYRWVGFYNKQYDNHMIMHWITGKKTKITLYGLYDLSRRLVKLGDESVKRSDAYGLSYTDIYDYAKKKQSLKKWEIDLGIHHQELGLSWDEDVPENLWEKVSKYCDNDVLATEAVWKATQGDFTARKMLAKIANGTPNDSTNKLSAKFIFEGNDNPQSQFNYRFMGAPEKGHTYTVEDDGITCWQDDGKPIFLGYEYNYGKSSYLDVPLVGEGGYVFAETGNSSKTPDQAGGMYYNVWTFDVSGEHPASIVAEDLWGKYYTARFKEILDLRLAIKHGEFEKAKQMFNGELAEYLDDPEMADVLSGALKLVVNSAYGMTASSKYETAFRDKRNIDNVVAKRGSLFMINLRYLVQKMGYTVVHCKTDSIKVVNPDQKIYNFIMDYGKKFGYTFEIEHKFEKICLVNNAVYIAKLSKDDPVWIKECKKAKEKGEPKPTRWTATGAQFAVPYVFKKLFSHEAIEFRDLCETKNVKVGEIYLDFNETLPDVSYYEHLKETKKKIEAGIKTTIKAANQLADEHNPSYSDLDEKIAKGHEYQFIGRVGLFCPVKEGTGGGIMYRYDGENYNAVAGTKGYRWKEAEIVKVNRLEDTIDESYYITLINDAIDTISQFGNYDDFVS